MNILYLFTCRPVNLSTCPEWLTDPDVNIVVQDIMGNSVFAYMSPVNLSPLVDRSRVLHIMPSSSLFIFRSVNPEGQVDRSTGEQVHNIHLLFVSIFSSGRVNSSVHLSTRVDRARCKYRSAGHYG